MSAFNKLEVAPVIEVFHMNQLYLNDTSPQKVNLTIGAYRTEEGVPWVLPVVREVEQQLALDETLNHEYLPVLGHPGFSQAAAELVLGENSVPLKEGRVQATQCLSGTGALRAGAEFLSRVTGYKTVLISNPTWGNHKLVFSVAGFTDVRTYRYWDKAGRKIDIDGFLEDLKNAPEGSVVLLHGCAHNPTGMDPTQEQWKQIGEVVKSRGLFPFFDIAYQGFASGNPDTDAWAIRHFVDLGLELTISQSFAKNFGLYNERVGNLVLITNNKDNLPAIRSQMSLVIRANWSNPPAHGARVVHKVLTTPELRAKWFESIQIMSSRIKEMRAALRGHLERLGTPGTWVHVTQQIGMFSFTGLTPNQVKHIVEKHKVFLLSDGRINICGLNTKNVEYVAKAIDETVRNVDSHI